jgi:cytochrome c oxidase subunit 3
MPRQSSLIESDRGGLPPIVDDFPPGGGGGGDDNSKDRGGDRKTSLIGIAVLMLASTMTFLALVSALIVRRGLGNDWKHLDVPDILYWNTGLLLASSVTLDIARRMLKKGHRTAFNWWWSAGTLLGLGFLAGQTYAWLELRSRGIYIATNPSHSFFYVLTWTHAVHAVGGLFALLYVCWQAFHFRLGPTKRTAVAVSTAFWHFLDVLWICLMLLFVYGG